MGGNLDMLANARNSMFDTFRAQAGAGKVSGLQALAQALIGQQGQADLQTSALNAQGAAAGSKNQMDFMKFQQDQQSKELDMAYKQAQLNKLLTSASSGDTAAVETQLTQNPGLLQDLQNIIDPKVRNAALQAYNTNSTPDAAFEALMKANMTSMIDPVTGLPYP